MRKRKSQAQIKLKASPLEASRDVFAVGDPYLTEGGVTLLDDRFGACLCFEGAGGHLSFEPNVLDASLHGMLNAPLEAAWSMCLWSRNKDVLADKIIRFAWLDEATSDALSAFITHETQQEWIHLAFTHHANAFSRIEVYLNGKPFEEIPSPQMANGISNFDQIIAYTGGQGLLLAQLSLFQDALGPERIQEEYLLDAQESQAFFSEEILSFELYDTESYEPALYTIHSNLHSQFTWNISNNSALPIKIPGIPGGIAGPNTFHFALVFPDNTFSWLTNEVESNDQLGQDSYFIEPVGLPNNSSWDVRAMIPTKSQKSNPRQVTWFLYTGAAPLQIEANASLSFQIKYHSALGEARSISVDFLYQNLSQEIEAGQTEVSPALSGTDTKEVSIFYQTGRKLNPFLTGIMGSGRFLSEPVPDRPLKRSIFGSSTVGKNPFS